MKVQPTYAEAVDTALSVMEDLVTLDGPLLARVEIEAENVTVGPTGAYSLTAGSHSRWMGSTLAGALLAHMTLTLPYPVRLWHINESGQRRLVLVTGDKEKR